MRVKASPEAVRLVQERGGRLYVRAERARCCGGALTLLDANFTPPSGQRDWIGSDITGIRLVLASSLLAAQEISVLFHRLPRRHLTALWNGCAWVG